MMLLTTSISCKRNDLSTSEQSVPKEVHQYIVLLDSNITPSDIEALNSPHITKLKRTSKSENRWFFEMETSKEETDSFLSKMKEELGILQIVLADDDETSDSNKRNTKKGTASPIKN